MAKFSDLLKLIGQLGEYVDEAIALAALIEPFQAAKDARSKAVIVVRAARIFTPQTDTEIDDAVVDLVEALLNSPEVAAKAARLFDLLKKRPAVVVKLEGLPEAA